MIWFTAYGAIVLAGAALLITSFIRLSHTDLGFKPQNLWVGFVTLPAAQYPDLGGYRFGQNHSVQGADSCDPGA